MAEVSSAEVLRKAATLMRERAQAATPGPWSGEPLYDLGVWRDDGGDFLVVSVESENEHDAEHIASWHPAVALAVADWLDDEATDAQGYVERDVAEVDDIFALPLAVARAYLGEGSTKDAGSATKQP